MALLQKVFSTVRPRLQSFSVVPVCYYYQKHIQIKHKEQRDALGALKRKANPESLIVFELPFTAAREDLETYFGNYGNIEYIKFPFDRNGLPCKCAEIKFEDTDSISKVKSINNHTICDQKVSYHVPKFMLKRANKEENNVNFTDVAS